MDGQSRGIETARACCPGGVVLLRNGEVVLSETPLGVAREGYRLWALGKAKRYVEGIRGLIRDRKREGEGEAHKGLKDLRDWERSAWKLVWVLESVPCRMSVAEVCVGVPLDVGGGQETLGYVFLLSDGRVAVADFLYVHPKGWTVQEEKLKETCGGALILAEAHAVQEGQRYSEGNWKAPEEREVTERRIRDLKRILSRLGNE